MPNDYFRERAVGKATEVKNIETKRISEDYEKYWPRFDTTLSGII